MGKSASLNHITAQLRDNLASVEVEKKKESTATPRKRLSCLLVNRELERRMVMLVIGGE